MKMDSMIGAKGVCGIKGACGTKGVVLKKKC